MFKVGQKVEVEVNPGSWFEGEIKFERNGLYCVHSEKYGVDWIRSAGEIRPIKEIKET